jgi:hypothetical protein
VRVCVDGVAARLKSGEGGGGGGGADVVTTRATVVEWLRLPLTPVIVKIEFPTGVELDVVTDSVDEPPLTVEKVPLAPVGKPFTFNNTDALKPLVPVIRIV